MVAKSLATILQNYKVLLTEVVNEYIVSLTVNPEILFQ